MKLVHFTEKRFIDSIRANGLSIELKQKEYVKRKYSSVDCLLNAYHGKERDGIKKSLRRETANYFLFHHDMWCKCNNNIDACVSVDTAALETDKLFVASMAIPELLYAEMQGRNRDKEKEVLCMHYWNDLFTLDFYLQNKKMINETYRRLWGMPFKPEVLYYKDIQPGQIEVYPIENNRNYNNNVYGIPYSKEYVRYKELVRIDDYFEPDGMHGVKHTKNVLYLSLILAEMIGLKEIEKEMLAYSAAFHDIGRDSNGVDDKHGEKALIKLAGKALDKILDFEQIEIIKKVIQFHCLDDGAFYKEIGVSKYNVEGIFMCLKDADALDRTRFNGLNSFYLRLDTSQVLEVVARKIQKIEI